MVLYLYLEDSHETSMMKKFCKYEITGTRSITLVREEKKNQQIQQPIPKQQIKSSH